MLSLVGQVPHLKVHSTGMNNDYLGMLSTMHLCLIVTGGWLLSMLSLVAVQFSCGDDTNVMESSLALILASDGMISITHQIWSNMSNVMLAMYPVKKNYT